MPLLPEWLRELHDQLFGILNKINAGEPLTSVHQECLALLVRHTAELSDEELSQSTAPPDLSRFLIADWANVIRRERPDDHDTHLFVGVYDYEGTGPVYEDFNADQRVYFAETINRLMAFGLWGNSPESFHRYAARLAESLRVYLEHWGYDVRIGAAKSTGEEEPATNTEEKGQHDVENPAILVLLGEVGSAIIPITQERGLSVNQKMGRIAAMDSRAVAWNSPDWADLLDVTDSWIRQQPNWKKWRDAEKKPD